MSRNSSYNRNRGPDLADELAKKIKETVSKKFKEYPIDELVKDADEFGQFLAKTIGLKTSQIRKFLDEIRRIQSDVTRNKEEGFFRNQSMLLKPKLAYAAGRHNEVKPVLKLLDICIDRVHDNIDFRNFARFVEAIIAYHRYYGGKD